MQSSDNFFRRDKSDPFVTIQVVMDEIWAEHGGRLFHASYWKVGKINLLKKQTENAGARVHIVYLH